MHTVHGQSSGAPSPRPIHGSGTVAERRCTLAAAARFRVSSGFRALLIVDPRQRGEIALRLRADDNVLPWIVAEVSAGVLSVGLRPGTFARLSELFVEATVNDLRELAAVQAATVHVRGLCAPAVRLQADQASRIDAAGQVEQWRVQLAAASFGRLALGSSERVEIELASASALRLSGTARHTLVDASGASRLLASSPSFETGRAHVQLRALARARLGVREGVTGNVSSLATLRVSGGAWIDVDGDARRDAP